MTEKETETKTEKDAEVETEIPSIVIKTRDLLATRGYSTDELFEYEDRFVMFPTREKDDMTIKMTVWMYKEPKVIGVAIVRNIVQDMEENHAQEGMIVGGARFTPAAKKHARITNVELVEGNYASFDLFGHQLVPEHTIATEDEIELVLDYYGIDLPQLPRIMKQDPAARMLGAKAGQVIRIERESEVAGRTYYYRVVIDKTR